MKEFYDENGIAQTFSAPRTLQQNGLAERKNMRFIEVARTMLEDSKLPTYFLAKLLIQHVLLKT